MNTPERKSTSHIFHFIMSLVTFGLWLWVWAFCALRTTAWNNEVRHAELLEVQTALYRQNGFLLYSLSRHAFVRGNNKGTNND